MKSIINKIKKYGFLQSVKKGIKYVVNHIKSKFSNRKHIKNAEKQKEEIVKQLQNAVQNVDRIIIWRSSFGWNVPLFQRPQHIANGLSKKRTLVLYEVTTKTDDVSTIKKQQDNLYLVNFENPVVNELVSNTLDSIDLPKYIQIYSTNWSMPASDLEKYIEKNYKIIYEYIDDLNPALAGTEELPVNVKGKYDYVMSHIDNIYVIVTADAIMQDVIEKRGDKNLAVSCNGVDYEFFKNLDENFEYDEDFKNVLDENKPIIGYYGALANWFDYELVRKLAEERPNYNIVFFGIEYDDSWQKNKLFEYKNIHFLGSRNYAVLKNFACKFSVCTIPFLINSITEATSPVKLFEYMALNKPIVTTDMKECRKYKSVMIAKTHDEYIELIDKAVEISNNKESNKDYYDLLNKEANENDWNKKAEIIVQLICKDEK